MQRITPFLTALLFLSCTFVCFTNGQRAKNPFHLHSQIEIPADVAILDSDESTPNDSSENQIQIR